MANNYCQGSCALKLEPHMLEGAKQIVENYISELDGREEYVGIDVDVDEDSVWIRQDEAFEAEQVAELVQLLLESLGIDEPFVFSWAYTCSKLRINEFGGGACVVRRGKEPHFIDAMTQAYRYIKESGVE